MLANNELSLGSDNHQVRCNFLNYSSTIISSVLHALNLKSRHQVVLKISTESFWQEKKKYINNCFHHNTEIEWY